MNAIERSPMKKLSNSELTTFCGQLALILRSGISSLEGLSIMIEDTPEGEGKKILETVLHELEITGSLYLSLEAAGCFPAYMCSMTEIGEHSGLLDDVMDSLAAHYHREEVLARSIRSAVTYPLIMLGMMIVILLILIVKVLPVFDRVYKQLGTGLTGFSAAVLRLGKTLGNYSVVFLVLIVLFAGIFFFFCCTQKGRAKATDFFSRFFMTRRLSEKTACARFASGMYLSLSSGLDTDQSLEMASRLVEHPVVSPRIRLLRDQLAQGRSFSEAAEEAKIFSGLYLRMINIGFRTGAMDSVMKQIASRYDEEIQEQRDNLLSRIEPALVAILSVAVGMILLSVMLPLIGIMSNIG